MISVYLCDDESIWLERLNKAITDYQIKSDWELTVAFQTTSPKHLLQHLTEDTSTNGIYFLDIDLKADMNGMQLAQQIRTLDPHASIIFITTHDEMVMETFRLKLEVLDYIIKDSLPLQPQIHQCLQHLENRYIAQPTTHTAAITIHAAGSYHTINLESIYYVESVKNTHKVSLHTHSAIYHFSDTLSGLQECLNADFIQCHKTCIVNILHIDALNTQNHQIILDNGEICICSVRAWAKILRRYRELHSAQ